MKFLITLLLAVTLAGINCDDEQVQVQESEIPRLTPVGLIYFVQFANPPPPPPGEVDDLSNTIPGGSYKSGKLISVLNPNNIAQEKITEREKRSPGGYGSKGGGICKVCGGGGGGYPGGGGYGGHGGGGYGGGGGGSWATSSSQSSAGSFGGGGYHG